jgi:hypothetical protein
MSDPMDLQCRARALRRVAEQVRIMSRVLSTVEDDHARVAAHAAVLERDAKRFEEQAFNLVERQRSSRRRWLSDRDASLAGRG